MAPDVAERSNLDGGGTSWTFDGVEEIRPALKPDDGISTLGEDPFLDILTGALRGGEPAWDPMFCETSMGLLDKILDFPEC